MLYKFSIIRFKHLTAVLLLPTIVNSLKLYEILWIEKLDCCIYSFFFFLLYTIMIYFCFIYYSVFMQMYKAFLISENLTFKKLQSIFFLLLNLNIFKYINTSKERWRLKTVREILLINLGKRISMIFYPEICSRQFIFYICMCMFVCI